MIKIKEKQARAIYTCLTLLPPFSGWKMPDEYRVEFVINSSSRVYGYYDSDPHKISISKVQCENYQSAIETMAHEMLHLKLERDGDPDHTDHKGIWQKYVLEICEVFGWDPENF